MKKPKDKRKFEIPLSHFDQVLAIDPGYANLGYAFGKKGSIGTVSLNLAKVKERPLRYRDIIKRILPVIKDLKPFVLIEHYSFGSGEHRLIDMAGVSELLKYAIWKRLNYWPVEIPPTTLKKYITGKGNSPKDQVLLAIYKKFGAEFKTNHEGDAYALARLGLDLLNGYPKALSLVNIEFSK